MGLCILVQISVSVIVQVKSRQRQDDFSYPLWFQVVNIFVRAVKLALDAIVLYIFLRVFRYYIHKKEQALLERKRHLTDFQERLITLTMILWVSMAYRSIFVCVNGILSQTSIDDAAWFSGDLIVHKYIVFPLQDFTLGLALLYLFFELDRKKHAMNS